MGTFTRQQTSAYIVATIEMVNNHHHHHRECGQQNGDEADAVFMCLCLLCQCFICCLEECQEEERAEAERRDRRQRQRGEATGSKSSNGNVGVQPQALAAPWSPPDRTWGGGSNLPASDQLGVNDVNPVYDPH